MKALELGGYNEDKTFTGINGGSELMTGFARNTVLGVAETVINAVKAGTIKHFFLVGGCDGAKTGRNYYTEFVQKTPKDTVVLTLACGKYRFNDLNIGEIGGLPRLLDMGQCNDAYSAIQVAVALANAFKCVGDKRKKRREEKTITKKPLSPAAFKDMYYIRARNDLPNTNTDS